MTFFQLFILSLIQGVTEFLPVSSSGHLILASALTGWQDQGLEMDVALHGGTLAAVVIYFFKDLLHMTLAFLKAFWYGGKRILSPSSTIPPRSFKESEALSLAIAIVVATVPAILLGAFIKKGLPGDVRILLRSPTLIAAASIGFGLLLWAADRWGKFPQHQAPLSTTLSWKRALIIGLFQALAFIPGTSRSGICITAGRLCSLDRSQAARFAFLLSIPTILGALVLTGYDCWKGAGSAAIMPWKTMMVGAGFSLIFGLMSIHGLLWVVSRASFTPFVLYRLLLGAVVLFL